MGVKVVGRDGDGPMVVFDRLIPLSFHFEDDAEIVMGFGVVGSQFDSASIVVQGPVEIAPFFQ